MRKLALSESHVMTDGAGLLWSLVVIVSSAPQKTKTHKMNKEDSTRLHSSSHPPFGLLLRVDIEWRSCKRGTELAMEFAGFIALSVILLF
jgi:hypothetical protein